MSVSRTLFHRLCAATREMQRGVGGIEAAAEITGKSKSQHGRFQSPHDSDLPTVGDIAMIEDISRGDPAHPAVTRLLCQLAGGVFVPLPAHDGDLPGLADSVVSLSCELGDVANAIRAGLADDQVLSAVEAGKVRRELDDLMRCCAALGQLLDARIAEGGR
ncbi:hypothetical protein FSZ31_04255 [Sphingorhabdus soli]|uniref:Uncharacterized protein n=1 Tax=Flavisphingopyxis soli TaxID=2601267 RepID=A0A5C6UN24_9SPHN|nr:phage regulatory CII family protein [Sphingorhabdus soli]TXC73940.1 hypothetical protein FSZ31_04255 [Sphingorhabdus soli]